MDKNYQILYMITNKSIFIVPCLKNIIVLYTIIPLGLRGHFLNVTLLCSKICEGDQDFQNKMNLQFEKFLSQNLTLTPKRFPFFKLAILEQSCHQISCKALWVELTEFLGYNFKMLIFKPIFNFFEILKANMVKHPERVMTILFFQIF